MVSIVLTVYNREKYISDCLNSICNQTYKNIEIIVIDDRSIDNTVDIVKSWIKKDPRIRLYSNEQHNFIRALNLGLKKSKGEFIARIDSDDIMEQNRIERQIDYLNKYYDIDIFFSWFKTFGDYSTKFSSYDGKISNPEIQFLLGNIVANPTSIFRRRVIDKFKIRYSEKYPHAEDYYFWVKCALAGLTFYCIPEYLLNYRIHKQQVTNLYFQEQENEAFEIRMELLNCLLKKKPKDIKNAIKNMAKLNVNNLVSSDTVFILSSEILNNYYQKGYNRYALL